MLIEHADILWAAKMMIKQHGEGAALHAGRRVDDLAEDGDLEGSDLWDRVLAVIVELQRGRREASRRGAVSHPGIRRSARGLGALPPARLPREGPSAARRTAQPCARGCPGAAAGLWDDRGEESRTPDGSLSERPRNAGTMKRWTDLCTVVS
jgi:hypothetical protein